ncbi:unnamed protein product [Darwinula stevensoni]|uniref:Uncharacterized protein n=1 Tax=Darwinula stevensoni TaxID=69355 RepID=A0A7R9FQ11_9CRUS|nr:unnamed protein product [Darwinula stevensoni]CAG0898802.1 unnamed protein product [Darwinula stevensoni]
MRRTKKSEVDNRKEKHLKVKLWGIKQQLPQRSSFLEGNETMMVDEDDPKKPTTMDVEPWGPLSLSLQSQIYLLDSVLVIAIVIFGISMAVFNRRIRSLRRSLQRVMMMKSDGLKNEGFLETDFSTERVNGSKYRDFDNEKFKQCGEFAQL